MANDPNGPLPRLPRLPSYASIGEGPLPAIEQALRAGPRPVSPVPTPSSRTLSGIGSRQFQPGPQWEGPGGLSTLGQMEQDYGAQELINQRYAQALRGIEMTRRDPFQEQIDARKKTLEYESLMPYGGTPRLDVDTGDGEMLPYSQENAPSPFPGGSTRGQVMPIEAAIYQRERQAMAERAARTESEKELIRARAEADIEKQGTVAGRYSDSTEQIDMEERQKIEELKQYALDPADFEKRRQIIEAVAEQKRQRLRESSELGSRFRFGG